MKLLLTLLNQSRINLDKMINEAKGISSSMKIVIDGLGARMKEIKKEKKCL